jgi:pSer/pThr/pTyr-binding forkhead associated (FHA) protein
MDVQLVVVKGNPRGRTLSFGPGEYLFGRGTECHVRPDSEWVSRQHCLLSVTSSAIHLKDLGSTNGTLVNGQRLVGERDLAHGDTIQVGPLALQVQLTADLQMSTDDSMVEASKQTTASSGEATLVDEGALSMIETLKLPSKDKSE